MNDVFWIRNGFFVGFVSLLSPMTTSMLFEKLMLMLQAKGSIF